MVPSTDTGAAAGPEHVQHLTSRGAATKARIVHTAAELMFDQGVAGTSIDDILAATHTSKSQLYHYFSGKAQLVGAVIECQTGRVLEYQDALLQDLDSMATLRDWAAAIIGLQEQRRGWGGCPLGSLASELSDVDESARIQLARSFGIWEQRLESGLRAMQQAGELRREADPVQLAASIMVALQGGLLLCQTTRTTRHLALGLRLALEAVERELL